MSLSRLNLIPYLRANQIHKKIRRKIRIKAKKPKKIKRGRRITSPKKSWHLKTFRNRCRGVWRSADERRKSSDLNAS